MTEQMPSSQSKPPVARLPLDPPSSPRHPLPPQACDAHLHIFGEPDRYPLAPNLYERPADGTLSEWLGRLERQLSTLGLERAVLVGSVVYREDNSLLLDALKHGGNAFRGVALVRPEATVAELVALYAAGVRGVRVNLRHPGALDFSGLKRLSPQLREAGLHVQLLLDDQQQFDAMAPVLSSLGLDLIVDHMGSVNLNAEQPFSSNYLRAIEEGWLYTKLSAPYRSEAAPYSASRSILRQLLAVRPDRILWGTDWPYLMYNGPKPDVGRLADWVLETCSSAAAELIFSTTPAALYFKD